MLTLVLLAACSSSDKPASDASVGGDGATDSSRTDAPASDASRTDGPAAVGSDVDVVITADNAYSFGYGDAAGIDTFVRGTRSDGWQIFDCPVGVGPHQHRVPAADAPDGAYLYIVSWDDLSTTQGVIGEFIRGDSVLYTGDSRFEVCATGMPFNTTDGPSLEQINAQIAACNAGSGDPSTTSAGWVNGDGPVTEGAVGILAVGEANDGNAGAFQQVCTMDEAGTRGVDVDARWMWYDPQDGQAPRGAFYAVQGVNVFRSFLIFRLAAGDILL